MIKALLLIALPGRTWDGIAETRRSSAFVFGFYLLPALGWSLAGEIYGLLRWGRRHENISGMGTVTVSHDLALGYGISQILTTLVVIFLAAMVIKSAGETFHSRNRYSQCLTLVAYSLAPLFLLRLMDGYPLLSPWITFAVGLLLSLGALYQGIPRILNPDPPQAFGLWVASAVMLTFLCGLGRLVTLLVLEGKLHL